MESNIESTKAHKGPSELEQVVSCPLCGAALADCITFRSCCHITCCKCATTAKERNNGSTMCPVCEVKVTSQQIVFSNPLMKAVLSLTDTESGGQNGNALQNCGECLQCGSGQSGFRCVQCKGSLCDGCRHRHLLIPSCKDHIVQQVFEGNPSRSHHKVKVDATCTNHPSKTIEMNCITCNTAICSQCKFEEHDTHSSESVESALDKYVPKVESICSHIDHKLADKMLRIASLEKQSDALLKNREQTKSQVEAHKEKLVQAVLAPINSAYGELCEQIDTNTESQLHDLTDLKDQLKYEVRDEQSVHQWAEVTAAFTSGGGLLCELQAGLMDRLEYIKQQQALEVAEIKTISLIQFVPSKIVIPDIKLGEVEKMKQDVSPAVSRAAVHADIHFRKAGVNLCKLPSIIGRLEKTVKVNTASTRMCLFDEKLWIPSSTTNSINVFPIEGDGESVETILDLGDVTRPHSLHPLNASLMALASDSGIYAMDASGHLGSLIKAGKFCDVFLDDKTLWALEWEEKKMYSWSVHDLTRVKDTFPVLQLTVGSLDTICVHRSSVYICSYDEHAVHKYNLHGDHKSSFGMSGSKNAGEVIQPTLCAKDGQGDLLVADCGNHRLQLLSSSGQWSLIPLKVFKPKDIIIVRSTMYVLHSEGNKISIYPL